MTTAAPQPAPAERKLSRQKAWSERNPLAHWAHSALRSGLRRGIVKQQPCQICGDPKSEGHHPSYDQPLLVTWLCRRHHKQLHAQEKRKVA